MMTKEVKNKTGKEEKLLLEISRQLEEYQREVQVAIEAVTNAPYELLSTKELCERMDVGPEGVRRRVERFNIPVHKIGNKNYYFWSEVRNSIYSRLRLWNLHL